MTDFLQLAKPIADQFNHALIQSLPASVPQGERLIDASRYSLVNGGKRVRPLLVYGAFVACQGEAQTWVTPACAIEMIHSYSLVHDDLPAMDDDDLRRGQPTCHIQYDEATAILVGDGLQTRAFEIIALDEQLTAQQKVTMVASLAQASGLQGMVLGQAIDLYSENKTLSLAQLEQLHNCKTGALIQASVQLGATAANANAQQMNALTEFAQKIGLAFQVVDDILDLESDTQTLGKPQGSDLAHNKATYPALLGLAGAKQKANELFDQAIHCLMPFAQHAEFLRLLAAFIVQRKY